MAYQSDHFQEQYLYVKEIFKYHVTIDSTRDVVVFKVDISAAGLRTSR